MAASFFRKAALEKLSTPEKLDQLIKVTGPKSWLALGTVSLAITAALIWAILGSVKTKLDVVGVVLGGEVHEVVATSQGQLADLKVTLGDVVQMGDVIASIEQPQLQQQIEEAKALLQERKFELGQLQSFGSQDAKLQADFIRQQRTSINLQIGTQNKSLSFLTSQLETEKELKAKGLITNSQLVNTQQQIEGAKNQIENLRAQLAQTSSQSHSLSFDADQREQLLAQRIAQTERNLKQLMDRFDIQSNIRSPYKGEVVEVLTDAGIIVGQGTPLFKLKNYNGSTENLKGVLYIPSQDGKKIKEGMQALIAPSTVKPQDFGFIKGKVTYVSDFPLTQKGMLTSVKNDQLVQSLLGLGAPFEVHVEFEKNPDSFSGFEWTSSGGPEVKINEGTSCMGKVTVSSQPPITIVIPALKKFFDLY